MKITVSQLRKLVNEEYLRGVRDFEIEEATRKYVIEIRHLIRKSITQTFGPGPTANEYYERSEEILKEFETEANELAKNQLWQFTQNV